VADQQIGRMENSNFYNGLENNPRAKTEFWLGVGNQARSGKLTRESGWELVYVLERSAPVFDKTGRVIGYVEVPKGGKSPGYRVLDASTGTLQQIGSQAIVRGLGLAVGGGIVLTGGILLGGVAGIGDDRYHMGMGILDGVLEAGQRLASEIDDYYDDLEKLGEKLTQKGDKKAKDSKIGTNQAENEYTDNLAKDLGLSKKEAERLHREISKKNYSEEEIRQMAEQIVRNRR
jgi:hypothetical protein